MQKELLISVVSSLASLLMPGLTAALNIGDLEFRIRPRLEGGLMYYEYEQDGGFNTMGFNDANLTISENTLEFKDTLPVVLGGMSFFIDRFFIDLNAQKAFNGSDIDFQSTSFSYSSLDVVSINQLHDTRLDADFDRTEYAISVGYFINERIAVFAGYKRAKTEFDNVEGSGTFSRSSSIPGIFSSTLQGSIKSDENFDFEYDGPFVGVAYGLNVNKDFFKGVLSFNSAAAFLNSDFERNVTGKVIYDDGGEVPFEEELDNEGNTLGVMLGLKWQGLIKQGLITQDDNIGYSIDVNAYQYNFDADDSEDPDIEGDGRQFSGRYWLCFLSNPRKNFATQQ